MHYIIKRKNAKRMYTQSDLFFVIFVILGIVKVLWHSSYDFIPLTGYVYTIDQREQREKKKRSKTSIRKELRIFVVISVLVFVGYTVATNAQLFWIRLQPQAPLEMQTLPEVQTTQHVQRLHQSAVSVDMDVIQQHHVDLVQGHQRVASTMSERLNDYTMHFNTLPVDNRVIVPRFGVNVPLVNSLQNKPLAEIDQGDFDAELYKGVVQYPTTANPGSFGNSLIFGHTSYASRKNNPYATVFQFLPQLQPGDVINTVWHGRQYSYIVEATHVVKPSGVNDIFLQYNDDAYLTLMGCYPLGTTRDRMMVIARLQS